MGSAKECRTDSKSSTIRVSLANSSANEKNILHTNESQQAAIVKTVQLLG